MNGDLSNLKCSKCGSDDTTWFIDNRPLCYTCAANGVVSQDILETRARKAFVPKSFNNGKDVKATLHISESEFQSQVIELLRLHGFKVAHFRPGMTNRKDKDGKQIWATQCQADAAGFPDIVAIANRELENYYGARQGVAWELKAGKNKATPEQTAWLDLFDAAGFHTGVYRPEQFEELKNLLEEM